MTATVPGDQVRDRPSRLMAWMMFLVVAPAMAILLGAFLSIRQSGQWWLKRPSAERLTLAEATGQWLGAMAVLALVVMAVALILALIIARRQSFAQRAYENCLDATVAKYLAFMEEVISGDLTARLSLDGRAIGETDDPLIRLGHNLNGMMDGLQSMAFQLQQEAQSVAEAATEILNATNEQIISATEQDSSVTQTAATVNEVRATVTETAERAQAVAETARRTVDVTRAGEQSVSDTINGMHLIRQRVESIADTILILSEHTQQIGEIIATVNAIADQSNMLALNASVEAARAGEEGKGFAVVAMEVRNLAAQSRQAVSQIRDILSEIQQTTNTAVMVTEQGTKGVDGGMSLVDHAGEAIRELASAIEEASHAATQIAASTRQQTVGMDQLSEAMQAIRDMTATNLSSTMRVERAARELNQVARRMDSTVSQYTLSSE